VVTGIFMTHNKNGGYIAVGCGFF